MISKEIIPLYTTLICLKNAHDNVLYYIFEQL